MLCNCQIQMLLPHCKRICQSASVSNIVHFCQCCVNQSCRYRRHSLLREWPRVLVIIWPIESALTLSSLSVHSHTTDLTSVYLKSQCAQPITHPADQQREGREQWDLKLLWWSHRIGKAEMRWPKVCVKMLETNCVMQSTWNCCMDLQSSGILCCRMYASKGCMGNLGYGSDLRGCGKHCENSN